MNRVALVTGAAGILGPAICRRLREAGWAVAAADREAGLFERARSLWGEVFWDVTFEADLAAKAACEELVREAEGALGPIGLVVNNAAMNPGRGPLESLDEEVAVRMHRVNVLAPLWLVAAARGSLKRQRGSVINISTAQTQGFFAHNHLYISGKAALEKLTETLAAEFLGQGVRVNAIRVGRVPGPAFLQRHLDELPPEAAKSLCEAVMSRHLDAARQHLGADCVGTPEQVAAAVAYLASPDASFMNGQVITLDGGFVLRNVDWVGNDGVQAQEAADAWVAAWRQSR